MARTQKTAARRPARVTVDYSTSTPAESRAMVRKAADAFKRWSGQEGDKTTAAAVALAESIHTGYVYSGPVKDKPEGSQSLADYARTFVVSRSLVTFWHTLAIAFAHGVATDSDVWTMLCTGKAARSSVIAEAVKREGSTPDAIGKVLKAAGWSVTDSGIPVHATGQGKGPRNRNQTDADADAANGDDKVTGDSTPVAPFDAAKAALVALAEALKSPTIQGDEWAVIDSTMVRTLKEQRGKRGLDTRTGRPIATKKAAAPAA